MKNIKNLMRILILLIIICICLILYIGFKSDIFKENADQNNINNIVSTDSSDSNELEEDDAEREEITEGQEYNLAKKYIERYTNLLKAFYGEENTYSKKFDKQELKEILYDISVKEDNLTIDNFMDNYKMTQDNMDIEIIDIFKKEDDKITKYFAYIDSFDEEFYAGSFEIVLYIDKQNNTFALCQIYVSQSEETVVEPQIIKIEKNSNNSFSE